MGCLSPCFGGGGCAFRYGVGTLAAIKPDPGFRWLASDWRVLMTGNLDKGGWQYGGVLWAKGLIGWSGNYSRLKYGGSAWTWA